MSHDVVADGWSLLWTPLSFGERSAPDDGAQPSGRSARTDAQIEGVAEGRVSTDTIDGIAVSDVLARLAADDQAALGIIYDAWYEPLWRLSVILTRSGESADEIVQTVFITLWERRHTMAHVVDLRAYLNTAVRNLVRMEYRHAHVVDRVESAVTARVVDIPAMGQAGPGPDTVAESAEFHRAYTQALAALSERERIALQLRLEHEQSFDEIGRALGVSKVAAYKIVQRAEEKARALLEKYRPA